MADFIGGIKQIGPAYPIKPVSPAHKDRKPGDRAPQPRPEDRKDKDDDDKPLIDEHV